MWFCAGFRVGASFLSKVDLPPCGLSPALAIQGLGLIFLSVFGALVWCIPQFSYEGVLLYYIRINQTSIVSGSRVPIRVSSLAIGVGIGIAMRV